MRGMDHSAQTILVVDDQPVNLAVLGDLLEPAGYQLLSATGASDALRIAAKARPDLILLDIMMPEISGLDILRSMRSNPDMALIPVVVISARATPTDIKNGLDAGASIYLTKPVSYMDLKNAVDGLLQGK